MSHPVAQSALNFDASIFQSMLAQVDLRYREIDHVFKSDLKANGGERESFHNGNMRKDSRGRLYFRIFGSKVFPFDVKRVGDAAWEHFSYSVRPNESSIFFQVCQVLVFATGWDSTSTSECSSHCSILTRQKTRSRSYSLPSFELTVKLLWSLLRK